MRYSSKIETLDHRKPHRLLWEDFFFIYQYDQKISLIKDSNLEFVDNIVTILNNSSIDDLESRASETDEFIESHLDPLIEEMAFEAEYAYQAEISDHILMHNLSI